ncbi:MAG: hypothetical protein WDM90_23675 [Ferruginibacter sp.]
MLYIPEGFAHGFQTLTNDLRIDLSSFTILYARRRRRN